MITVSKAWETAAVQTLLPEMFVEITCDVTEPGLAEDATVSATLSEDYSDVSVLVGNKESLCEKYSTLEHGCWGLDGTYTYFDGTPVNPGYVSTVYSGEGGTDLANAPTITVHWDTRRDILIPGFSIIWSNLYSCWAVDFTVKAYNSGNLVASKTVTKNASPTTYVDMELVGYTDIAITVTKWSHPYQRVRCIDIDFGTEMVYTKDDLLGFDHKQSVDMLSASLPNSEIVFKLRNDDDRWNPDNPKGYERYLVEQQEVKLRYGMDIDGVTEWIPGGVYWISEWDTPSNGMEANFTARDAFGFMNGRYSGPKSGTLDKIAYAAFVGSGVPKLADGTERIVIHPVLSGIETTIADDYTNAEVLQMVAHAGCCVLYQDRSGIVRIEPRSEAYSGYRIDPGISYSHPEYTISKPLREVSVGYGSNDERVSVVVSSRGEVQTVDNKLIMTEADALRVGEFTRDVLENRKVITGEFRADMRMDALDNIIVVSKYASNVICVTDIAYSTTGGAFRGKYTGRVATVNLASEVVYSGERFAGEF